MFTDLFTIINVTPHSIKFFDAGLNEEFTVQPSGVVINAIPVEDTVKIKCGLIFVQTRFVPDPESERELARLEREQPGALIVGSIIAAQAFPGRVLAMTPAPGYERVPTDQKRMNPWKFTTFGPAPMIRSFVKT